MAWLNITKSTIPALLMIVLGIESSCDDTAAAILDSDGTLYSDCASSQDSVHARFGGVVPELASRSHMVSITSVVNTCMDRAHLTPYDIDLISVTQGPGLIGSLLVGFSYAKSLALALKRPFVGVDHMAGHLLSVFLEDTVPDFPYIALIVSGGTTALFRVDSFYDFELLGRTRDDAAGEAFDKVARLLGLGYPGGPAVASLAAQGDPGSFDLPRAWLGEGSLDFSFSGVKTSVLNHYKKLKGTRISDLCTSFQDAVVDVLCQKTLAAAHRYDIGTIVLGGGVSANAALRATMAQHCSRDGRKLFLPAIERCTDNGAMIAFAGLKLFEKGTRGNLDDDVFSRSQLGQ